MKRKASLSVRASHLLRLPHLLGALENENPHIYNEKLPDIEQDPTLSTPVRTVPPWVLRPDQLPRQDTPPSTASSNHPPWPGATADCTESRWRAFRHATAYARSDCPPGRIVSNSWLREHGANYDEPWLVGRYSNHDDQSSDPYHSRRKRRVWYIRLRRTVLRSPVVPMIIRLTVFGFSLIALALAVSVHNLTKHDPPAIRYSASTLMAIVVDAVACAYLLYITYDEYTSKPLGLRSTYAKLRLIFLDLFFIVFNSSNLSLAFESIGKHACAIEIEGRRATLACTPDQHALYRHVIDRQRALASVLLIVLVAWLMTFAISIAR